MMGKAFLAAVFLAALTLIFAGSATAVVVEGADQPEPHIMPGLVTVVLEDDVNVASLSTSFGLASFAVPTLDDVMAKYQVSQARSIFPWEKERPDKNSNKVDFTRYYELKFPENIDLNEVIDALMQNPHIRQAEPVWAMPLAKDPNDPSWTSQYHIVSTNMNLRGAWDIETGSDSIIFAIVDSGVGYLHPDLTDNIWVNPGEDVDGDHVVYDTDDLNGIDDDGNGVVDDLIGYDFFTGFTGITVHPLEDGGTPDPDPIDFNGHGTHCAGIAAAATNNGVNVSSMAGGWFGGHRSFRGIRIMCLRVGASASDGSGYVNSNNCGSAIQYAARNGAKIVSCSWGSSSTTTMNAAMTLVDSADVTICHAAGNDNCNCPDYLDYDPSGIEVLSVASVGSGDVKSSFSNYGVWVDVSAFGESILSTYTYGASHTNTVATQGGTSMACPMVAGLAGLIRSTMPSLTKSQVDSLIESTADDIYGVNPSYDQLLGSGRIDAYNALADLGNAKFSADYTEGQAPLTVNFTDLSPNSPTSWEWTFSDGGSSYDQNPVHTFNDPGIYDVSLVVDDASLLGPGEEHLKNYVWVTADTAHMDSIVAAKGEHIMLPLNLTNTVQIKEIQLNFDMTNSMGITFDSFSVVGTRTEYFNYVQKNVELSNQYYGILFRTDATGAGSNYLQPGSGPIANLYFYVSPSASAGVLEIDTLKLGSKVPRMTTIWGDYYPVNIAGKIVVPSCLRGDMNCDGAIAIDDLVFMVAYMFSGGPAPDPFYVIDVNGSGGLPNIEDLVYLVDYMFNGGPQPPA
ncbi:MAG TPA: S8 family serine peptidase [candidate division Zixibacteria bacterium]|nr:S8 family serine peptidase [candidate division Zixibacteria bacterium]